MSNAKKIPARNEVDKNVCWSIEDLFPSDQAWTEARSDERRVGKECM